MLAGCSRTTWPFRVEALQCGLCSVYESNDDLALAGRACALNEDVVAIDDVFVAHGVAAHFESEDITIADYVVKGNALRSLSSFDRQPSSDPPNEREAVARAGTRARRQNVDRTAAVVDAVEQALLFKIGDVLVDGGQAL